MNYDIEFYLDKRGIVKMKKLTWKEVKEEIESDFTEEDFEELRLEEELIEATIEARKKAELTQQQLSNLTGIKQPSIAKIEKFVSSPQASTLIRLLYPLGYTLKVVPIDKEK